MVTFDRHPASVVRPDSAPKQLTSLEQKLELLAECGIGRTLVVPFDEARADETAEEFVEEVLVDELGARLVVVGEDFHFGHGRKGNVELLRRLGADHGFEVVGVGLTDDGSEAVSSTRIRAPHRGGGRGERRPSSWDGPTRCGVPWCAATGGAVPNWGSPRPTWRWTTTSPCRPTASTPATSPGPTARSTRAPSRSAGGPRSTSPGTAPVLVEAYLLDFDGDLYGEAARVSFRHRLRPELRFESVEALIAQMKADVDGDGARAG